MFRSKDMCLIIIMNSGNLLSRWMGTISLSKNHTKCVVFSTVSDVTVKNCDIQWNTYVKRVLDLPAHNSLVKLEGICVNQVNLYLVHEHLTCDSLESIISSRRIASYRYGAFPTSEVASYLMDILGGMEVLHSFGFLLPGLSTKKVLVTDKGQCKLYDFFLSEDAPNKTRNMKSEKDCSINDLPPEALLRNEYSQASDMWCVAVVLWKLMTYDLIPVVLQNMDERKVCSVTQDWPASHLGLKNPLLFECWMYDDSFRPSVNKLRSSFEEVIRNVQAFSISEDTEESMSDLYISMDGIKTTLQRNSEMDRTQLSLE
ncbi:Ephrin type-A receptor 3 [Holothuria leucospilota]|uniref:Ephrin type-A receptor 3 n=1 Tax=Holothuria leucospilota TaxID=206669 RepID=A0A9Q1CPQ7_HOLLE|nr:Ephrin type-A receptor 3 [Holothuria leucospilota]